MQKIKINGLEELIGKSVMQKARGENDLSRKILKGANVLFVTHAYITIFSNLFRDFTSARCNTYTIIRHPLFPFKGTASKLFVYKKEKMQRHISISRIIGPYSLNFLKDFFLTIFWGLKTGIVYDIAFGTNNLNTLSLLALKKLGRVKKVVFVSIDYTPSRYENPVLNFLYHWFDRICCYHADIIWNSSRRMNEARVKNGVDPKKIVSTIVMPDGSNFDPKKRLPINKIDRKKLIFLGGMRPITGAKLILESFKDVIKEVPDVTLLLIGGGPKLEEYKKLAQALELGKHVSFTGFIERHEDVDDLLCTGAIGLAPFVSDKSSYEYYSDAGKPKAYLAAGMPVIITRVPEIADEIEKERAGIVIEYSKIELTNALVTLLKDDKKYKEFRENAVKLSKKYIWSNIFNEAYKQTFKQTKN